MPDIAQLPHLLRLLDDETPVVREAVLRELRAYGDSLEEALEELPEAPTEGQRALLGRLLGWDRPSRVSERRLFSPGQLVRHQRYGYRGVIVDYDMSCQADEDWYRSNATQPAKDQPWYHVLVHNSTQITYAAQTSLMPDESRERVRHPLVPYFFEDFKSGRYVRNQRPWML